MNQCGVILRILIEGLVCSKGVAAPDYRRHGKTCVSVRRLLSFI